MKLFSLGPQAHEVRPRHAGSCHDCAAPVKGKYCSQCGQSSHVHVASAGEFIHHFIGHFVAAEGKLWRTFGDLLRRPGQLTVDFISGRRMRHIDPLRLLLTVSMLVFGALKLQTHLVENKQPGSKPATVQTQDAKPSEKPLTTKLTVAVFERLSPTFRKHLDEYEALPAEERSSVLWHNWLKLGPTLILCLIPVIALFLKLLNAGTGWRYGEHLVFSMHLQTFALLDFLAWMLLEEVMEYGAPIALLALAVYMLFALRRMYGGSWLVLAARWAALVYLEVKAFLLMSLIAFFISLL
ncbi:DUF3667 domain-containing protein [Duganella sp. HH105]|uniref:DUF3667 domain-containing protein n=1 Tax=Duganella sp. HH105 TaxID=1781067 RepID=UPI000893271F|nr:DUF3667 domain-containing protein [Duganella sp. HH105]OEZ62522.1 hypothetical protein DUGA6_13090 [Duganella sp. HH105]